MHMHGVSTRIQIIQNVHATGSTLCQWQLVCECMPKSDKLMHTPPLDDAALSKLAIYNQVAKQYKHAKS